MNGLFSSEKGGAIDNGCQTAKERRHRLFLWAMYELTRANATANKSQNTRIKAHNRNLVSAGIQDRIPSGELTYEVNTPTTNTGLVSYLPGLLRRSASSREVSSTVVLQTSFEKIAQADRYVFAGISGWSSDAWKHVPTTSPVNQNTSEPLTA